VTDGDDPPPHAMALQMVDFIMTFLLPQWFQLFLCVTRTQSCFLDDLWQQSNVKQTVL
jgi:hypothetical protein